MPVPPLPDPAAPAAASGLGRRTDAMLRGLLLLVALFHVVYAGWLALRSGPGLDRMVPAMAILHVLVCLLCLLEHFAGRSVRAASTFVLAQLPLLMLTYGYWGLGAQLRLQLLQMVPLLLVAAVLGHRTLTWAAAALCAVLLLGSWVDASGAMFRGDRLLLVGTDLGIGLFGVLLTAWLLHHSVTGLRESLQVVQLRSQELARKRDELQLEMQERERARDQLVHAMKMENVGRLASGIAHDFNHLLGLIQMYVAKAGRSEGAPQQTALQGADAAVRRASAVSRRLMDFSRLEAARPQLLDAAATVNALLPLLEQVFDRRVDVELDTAGVQCLIHFDPAQLESILLSLAVNAQQAMPEGGRFSVSVSPEAAGDAVTLRIQDTGHGMSEEVRRRCLEPFYTTKPVGQGTGLGLAVTASLVAAAGGSVQVDSRPGHGTRVDLRLPSRPRSARLPQER
ncbi:ATP-binding protein [Stenotrophomonas sp.]|uniref:sensor histidine kinase n=1 Tax=Stenotrophomonas sp. TaxID=69392 RepID=UPI00289745AF|nr:ATP-binding protein [Stenotrophomonas sp.]